MSDINQTFKGKTVFCTGATGFLGKVLIYKILKEFPDVEAVYCMVRPKKGVPMQQRLEKEILSSPCYFPLIKAVGEEEWKRLRSKVHAVAGDITHHRLGLSNENYELLCAKTHFIIHLAATVDFQEKLNLSLNMNCLGSCRILALAQRCTKLEALIHTSTCYVNYPRHGSAPVHEQVYPIEYDPEMMVKYIMSLTEEQLPAETKRLLNKYNYPNTYTFTKNITESILLRRRGSVPLAIVRPSIVGAAWREPYQGWVDALTAAGGIFLTVGLGICHDLVCRPDDVTDVVPVDFVVNVLLKATHKTACDHKAFSESLNGQVHGVKQIAAAAAPAKEVAVGGQVAVKGAEGRRGAAQQPSAELVTSNAQQQQLNHRADGSDSAVSDPGNAGIPVRVYQCSTSTSMNPARWATIHQGFMPYWASLKHPKALSAPMVRFHDNLYSFEASVFLRQRLPLLFAKALNSIPGLHDKKKEVLFKRYEKALARNKDLNSQFWPFMKNHWYFEQVNTDSLDESLAPFNRANFSHDSLDINWFHYGKAYSWGMIRFIMKEDYEQPKAPPSGSDQLMKSFL